MKARTLENVFKITARRSTTMFVVVLFGWLLNIYPWWQMDSKRVSRISYRRWKLTGGWTLHLLIFGVRFLPYRLTCPECGGRVLRRPNSDLCIEPGICGWSQERE